MKNIFHLRRLRLLRRAFALTQKDLALLLGLRNGNYITKLENGLRKPSHSILSRLIIIFDKPAKTFIPDIVEQAMIAVHDNTLKMKGKISDRSDKKAVRQLELLNAIMSRMATNQHKNNKYDNNVTGDKD